MANFTKENNPITNLRRENEEVKRQLEELQKQLKTTQYAQSEELPYVRDYDPNDPTDDRNDIVTYVFQDMTTKKFIRGQAKKYDAMMFLYNHYLSFPATGKYVPKFDERDYSCNDAPCYVRIVRRNHERGYDTYYKDMPLWILVDRLLNHPNYQDVRMVRKEVWLEDQLNSAKAEGEWGKEARVNALAKGVEKLTTAIEQAGGI